MANCPRCGKDTKSAHHITAICLAQDDSQAKSDRRLTSHDASQAKLTLRAFQRMSRVEIVKLGRFVVTADGQELFRGVTDGLR
jgi:hypothetical protein